ncbi:MAG: 30S ribosomal protein S17 [Bdellovibrio sp.]
MKEKNQDGSPSSPRGRKIQVTGRVISNKMQKTIAVEVFRMVRHGKYGKFLKMSSVFKAHDEKNQAQIGDLVKITEGRPLSRTKRWLLSEILESNKKVGGPQ